VLDDDEAVFGVLERDQEKAAYKTEDQDMTPHGGFSRIVLGTAG
jgi:hypothetical protein